MCGIAGIALTSAENSLDHYSSILLNGISRRGLDSQQKKRHGDNIVLCHSRLAIVDNDSRSNQPFTKHGLTIVYNGEVYNYKQIREQLQDKGISFQTQSDTEVIVSAYHIYGPKAFEMLDGMFAFAIYDPKNCKILLCRDLLGVKPLYYCANKLLFSFASTLSAISDLPIIEKSLSLSSSIEYFQTGCISGSRTPYNEIKKLEPGQYLEYDLLNYIYTINFLGASNQYLNYLLPSNSLTLPSIDDYVLLVKSYLHEAINKRLLTNYNVDCFLSGGVDSSLIASLLSSTSDRKINAYTIGFDNFQYSETSAAKIIADSLDINHVTWTLTKEDVLPLCEILPNVYDEPFSDPSCLPTLAASMLAASCSKVVLGADGGDELFMGYPRHLKFIQRCESLKYIRPAHRLINRMFAFQIPSTYKPLNYMISHATYNGYLYAHHVASKGSRYVKHIKQRQDLRFESHTNTSSLTPRAGLMHYELQHTLPNALLPKVDRSSMYAQVEVRHPFLDFNLLKIAAQIPASVHCYNNQNKYILRSILSHYLPSEIINAPKSGFTPPLRDWMDGPLHEYICDYLPLASSELSQILNTKLLDLQTQLFKNRETYDMNFIWSLFVFSRWLSASK